MGSSVKHKDKRRVRLFTDRVPRVCRNVFRVGVGFCLNEDGMQTLGVVMLIALGAVAASGIWVLGRTAIMRLGELVALMTTA